MGIPQTFAAIAAPLVATLGALHVVNQFVPVVLAALAI